MNTDFWYQAKAAAAGAVLLVVAYRDEIALWRRQKDFTAPELPEPKEGEIR